MIIDRGQMINNLHICYLSFNFKPMNKIISLIFLFCAGIGYIVQAQKHPESNIRPTAYPLITIDPFTSAWSQADHLYDDHVRHWTGVEHPLLGAIRVDGKVYRFMGSIIDSYLPVLKTAKEEAWQARYTFEMPASGWIDPKFDDSAWKMGKGAFGTPDMAHIATPWSEKDIWIRRDFDLDQKDLKKKKLYLIYSHDDVFELYINGQQVVNTGLTWNNNVILPLSQEVVKTLNAEGNVIAAHCFNTRGGAYVDFGILCEDELNTYMAGKADQIKASVLPIQTYSSFYCGPVLLDLKFTSPLVLNNLDLLSSPVNYVSYEVKSMDGLEHDVQLYFEATPQWAVTSLDQEVKAERYRKEGMTFLKAGTTEQKVLGKCGDVIAIDWGYFFLAGKEDGQIQLALSDPQTAKSVFTATGKLPDGQAASVTTTMSDKMVAMTFVEDLGRVGGKTVGGHLLVGYDDVKSVQYFKQNLDPYWKKKFPTIELAFADAEKNYAKTMKICDRWDEQVMEDACRAGGQQYAEICAATYRQSVAAHKLVEGPEGELFFFSKECNSNGSIGTVDVTYPSCPLFLRYNTEVAKAMLNFIFDYSESGRWTKPFPAHDVGTYPWANGQTYLEDMPVEEAGNMIIITTAIAMLEGNADYAAKHWDILTVWADYLMEKGMDPENQLCTEDFAGHLAHNTNLSAKAIMAIAGYGKLATMLKKPEAKQYTEEARKMALQWEKMADDGDHYRLAFDLPDSWSQKYNFVWDKVLGFDILPRQVYRKEIAHYLKQQNEFGLPLDNRYSWSRVECSVWCATMADDMKEFEQLINPLWKYIHYSPSRYPLGDWFETTDAKYINFRARSVVGGVFMKTLEDYLKPKR